MAAKEIDILGVRASISTRLALANRVLRCSLVLDSQRCDISVEAMKPENRFGRPLYDPDSDSEMLHE